MTTFQFRTEILFLTKGEKSGQLVTCALMLCTWFSRHIFLSGQKAFQSESFQNHIGFHWQRDNPNQIEH